jgi:hypothetical protein
MLAALQLTRAADGTCPLQQRVYIANTLKCRPPRNRNPAPEEMLQCEPFLLRQIDLLQPRMILAMGRFAVQALLRSSEPIGKLRGRVHRYHGVPLVVTYHPAYLLRNLPDKARAWEDLCLAAGGRKGDAGPPQQAHPVNRREVTDELQALRNERAQLRCCATTCRWRWPTSKRQGNACRYANQGYAQMFGHDRNLDPGADGAADHRRRSGGLIQPRSTRCCCSVPARATSAT